MICPHGDATCPCPDGGACHYEGRDPMPCPNPPGELPHLHFGFPPDPSVPHESYDHCHVEGCTWDKATCGFARMGVPRHQPVPPSDPRWACGAARTANLLLAELGW